LSKGVTCNIKGFGRLSPNGFDLFRTSLGILKSLPTGRLRAG
jgi:hypothetical protein